MGSFKGHALPGSFFTAISLWWLANVYRIYSKHLTGASIPFKSTTWFPIPVKWLRNHPIEPAIKIFLAKVGIFLELCPNNHWVLVGNDGEFVESSLNNYAHAAMYVVFMIVGVVEALQFYKVTQLPSSANHAFGAIALFVEGILFFFHLEGRPKLDQLLHTILYVIIFMAALVLIIEAWMKDSFLLLVFRASLFLLQGTWLFQIAHSLHGVRPWKDTKRNREFVTIAFAWHVIGILVLIMVGFIVISIKSRGCCCRPASFRDEDIEVHEFSGDGFAERIGLMDEQE